MEKMLKHCIQAMLMMCCFMLLSCEIDNSDSRTDEYRRKLADSYWQLTEIRDFNNHWQTPEVYPVLDIPRLWFSAGNGYRMDVSGYRGSKALTSVVGSYHIEDGTVSMTDSLYQGMAFSLYISLLEENLIEGVFTMWNDLVPVSQEYSSSGTSESKTYGVRLRRVAR